MESNNEGLENIKCNLCRSNKYSVVHKAIPIKSYEERKKFHNEHGHDKLIEQVVRCNTCGLVYTNPRPTEQFVMDSYSGTEKQGYSVNTNEGFLSQVKCRELTFSRYLKLIEKYVGSKPKVLDIGTAGGSFLYVAQKRGWNVIGIEPNKKFCEWGRKHYGIDIRQGNVFDNHFPDETFDAITLWDVLEHINDPKKTLKECSRLLKKNGVLVINCPDIGSFPAKIMRRKWVFFISDHLYYFNRKTLNALLTTVQLKLVTQRKYFQFLYLDYLCSQFNKFSKLFSVASKKAVNLLHLGKIKVPYWLGQSLFISKKQ